MMAGMVAGVVLISSCSPRLVGVWAIESYKVKEGTASGVNVNNVGTITFKKGNNGEKNIMYSVFQNKYEDKSPFKWYQDDEHSVRIEGENSDFSKTWLITGNGRKQQVWRSTDGANRVQELVLRKQ